MQAKMNFLLDRSLPFDSHKAQLLDELTYAIKNNTANSKDANQSWRQLKEDHYFWYNADKVLTLCQLPQTKFYMLVLLEDAIKQKWMALPSDERAQLKAFIISMMMSYAEVDNLEKTMQNILAKCNSILIQIVKYEWDNTWTTFIEDICSISSNNINVCQNCFSVLKMLSQEIFDYSKSQLTHQQVQQLKTQMNQHFTTIFQLCKTVLQNAHQAKPSLVKGCLQTLNAFLSWIPMYYIIYTDMIEKLVSLFQVDYLRNHALGCLVEIASLPIEPNDDEQKNKYLFMLQKVTEELNKLIPLSNNNEDVERILHSVKKKNRNIFEILARGIANFYSEFFKHQHSWLERAVAGSEQGVQVCRYGLKYLLMMMKIDEDQVFKITIDFFHFYVGAYLEQSMRGDNNFTSYSYGIKGPTLEQTYQEIFMEVMKTVCLKMAKPEEVLIVIDEDGIPVREEIQNTQNTSLYEIQRQLAQFLVKYNWPQMKKFIINEIQRQHIAQYFSFDKLNSLSWIVGSLCGSIKQRQERSFFISTLRTLLQLCENRKGKQNKAVIASCIMYVVGQYPTFLRHNWSFLKTVVRKLFDFMKEEYPGIMEMACNAFLKIAKFTADQFVITHPEQPEPYIREIIRKTPDITHKLSSQSLQYNFYESLGYLISGEVDSDVQLDLMKEALGSYYFEYNNIIVMAKSDNNLLRQEAVIKKLIFFFKLNEMLATGVGRNYAVLLNLINQDMNKCCLFYSIEINEMLNNQGKTVLNFMSVKNMRMAKRGIIKVYTRMLQKCNQITQPQAQYIHSRFIMPLGQLMMDFQNCPPQTKDQQFVALFTVVLQKLNMVLSSSFLAELIDMIFSSSLPLITSDFNSFPEIRANFFTFLKSLVKFNFGSLFSLQESYFNSVLNCVIWSLKHQLSTYSDLGLDLLQQILSNVNKINTIVDDFYARYHMKILAQILEVMTDGFHKSGLKTQIKIFYVLVHVVTQGLVRSPIAPDIQQQSNEQFLYSFLAQKLSFAFTNVNQALTYEKVGNWFKTLDEKLFESQIEDYLVLINRFSENEGNQK